MTVEGSPSESPVLTKEGRKRRFVAAAVIGSAFFMHNLDGTIVATSLPQIAISIGENPLHLSVTITAYLLSLSIFIPVSGWLADRFGARNIFQAALVVFTVGSVLCGFANNLTVLTLSRVFQAIGGAMMIPVGRLLVLHAAPKSEYVRALAFLSAPGQIASVLGAPIGGFITTYASWRWNFFINVPIGIIGMILVMRYVDPDPDGERDRRPMDWLGFVLTAGTLGSVMYGLDQFGQSSNSMIDASCFIAVGAVICVIAVIHARRARHPLLEFPLLRITTFRVNFWAGALTRVAWGAQPFLFPLLFQVVFGMTAFTSGLLMFALSAGSLSTRVCAPPIFRRFGFRHALICGVLVLFGIFLIPILFTSETPHPIMFLVLLLIGLLWPIQATGLNSLAFADLPAQKMSAGTSIAQLVSQFGNALGVAIAAIVLHATLAWSGGAELSRGNFQIAFMVMALLSLVPLPFYVSLPPEAGEEVSGHRRRGNT